MFRPTTPHFKGEVKEMVELYKQKGFSEEDATEILNIMGNHKEFFIDHMMEQVSTSFLK